MNISLYQAAAALNANTRWQEMIGENLVSSSIVGFKKQDMSFEAVKAGLMPQSQSGAAGSPTHFSLTRATPVTNFSPGELNITMAPWDIGLETPGFFEVQLPSGSTGYTRNGSFQLNAQGMLVTKAGYLVLGESGPIQMDPRNAEPVAVAANGEIRQGAEIKGRIKVVNFNDPGLLTGTGGSYFIANNPDLQSFEVEDALMRQGFLEASNTSAVHEMANLIMAMRHYEANQKVIQTQDDRMSRAISELGNPA